MEIRTYSQNLSPVQEQPGNETGPEPKQYTDHEVVVNKVRATNRACTDDTLAGTVLLTIHFSHCPHCKN